MRHGTLIQFTGSTGIYQYHNENIPMFRKRKLAKTNKNWPKVNEIESLKTVKSPGIILEKSVQTLVVYSYAAS